MKKTFFLIFLLLAILIPSVGVLAEGGTGGLVPCHPKCDADGKNCSECTIADFFALLANIYNFMVLKIATPLAIIALIIGGVFMMVSAGNPNLFGTGKKILFVAIIGLVLVFCSWAIINFIMQTLGYELNGGNWSVLPQ